MKSIIIIALIAGVIFYCLYWFYRFIKYCSERLEEGKGYKNSREKMISDLNKKGYTIPDWCGMSVEEHYRDGCPLLQRYNVSELYCQKKCDMYNEYFEDIE